MSQRRPTTTVLAVLVAFSALRAASPTEPKAPPKEPAKIELAVAPVSPGAEAKVTLRLSPAEGIKINRYPQIKLKVPASAGLVDAAEVAVGNTSPPPPERIETNYYKTVDPVELNLRVDAKAPAGEHRIPGQLSYFYCVAASGFCAPAKVPVTIPLTVR